MAQKLLLSIGLSIAQLGAFLIMAQVPWGTPAAGMCAQYFFSISLGICLLFVFWGAPEKLLLNTGTQVGAPFGIVLLITSAFGQLGNPSVVGDLLMVYCIVQVIAHICVMPHTAKV